MDSSPTPTNISPSFPSSLLLTNQNFQNSQNVGVWHTDKNYSGATIYFIPYKYSQVWPLERRLWNAEFTHRMFTQHWHFSLFIVLAYVGGVHFLKKWMEQRKAFDLRFLLFFWNAALATFSIVGTLRCGEEFAYVLRNRSFQDSICLSISPTEPVAFWATCFALSKIAEFGDTIFLVLRKRPLIFLHWFHHAVVLVYSWHSATELTAAGRWFIQLNYMVHSVMYTYYALACVGLKAPKFVAMCVTAMQTTQMLIGVFISLYVAFLKWTTPTSAEFICQQSAQNMCICFAIYSAFAVLFARFFIRAYCSGKGTTAEKEGEMRKRRKSGGRTKIGGGSGGGGGGEEQLLQENEGAKKEN